MDAVTDVVEEDDMDVIEDVVDGDLHAAARRITEGGAAGQEGDAVATPVSVEVHAYLREPSRIRTCRGDAQIG
jgi:hypothetical protein